MDSLTQITLGAAVGEAVLGRKLGNKAIAWGALAGTIPDLDIVFLPFLDEIGYLTWHRGYSHSLFFAIIAALLLAYPFRQWYKTKSISFHRWWWFWFLGLFTHMLLDCCTVYGTQLFLPFTDYRVGLNNIFILDPLYTVPLLIFVFICFFLKRNNPKRKIINYVGLSVSSLYLLISFAFKYNANNIFQDALEKQGIDYVQMMTAPTPLNTVLWYCVAEDETGYNFGLYSMMDDNKDIEFVHIKRNGQLIDHLRDNYKVGRLLWFSNGYYIVKEAEIGIDFYDAKFGKLNISGDDHQFVFKFNIQERKDGSVEIFPSRNTPDVDFGDKLSQLYDRIRGIEP